MDTISLTAHINRCVALVDGEYKTKIRMFDWVADWLHLRVFHILFTYLFLFVSANLIAFVVG